MSGFHDKLVARVQIIHGHADVLGAVVDAGLLARAAAALAAPFADERVTKVAGLEARGFIFGARRARSSVRGSFRCGRRAAFARPQARVVTHPTGAARRHAEVQRARRSSPATACSSSSDWAETGAQTVAAKR